MQIRLRIVSPGRVYRRDDLDATHSFQFHQVKILALEPIGEYDLGHLQATVEHFLNQMLGPDMETRFQEIRTYTLNIAKIQFR